MKTAHVYIMASTTRTTYIGVTTDLAGRVWQHKTHAYEGFTKRYDVTKLVYIEEFFSHRRRHCLGEGIEKQDTGKKSRAHRGAKPALERLGVELVRGRFCAGSATFRGERFARGFFAYGSE